MLVRNTSRAGVFHFHPVTFDNGYFSSLSVCVHSILKEFKFKSSPLFKELLQAPQRLTGSSQIITSKEKKSIIEAIDDARPIG